MNEEKLLKQITICSVFLLCIVLVFSHYNKHTVSIAGELQITPTPAGQTEVTPTPAGQTEVTQGEESEKDLTADDSALEPSQILPMPTPTETPQLLTGGWEYITGAAESELVTELQDQCVLVIEKAGTGYENTVWSIEEIPVNRILKFTISGITGEEIPENKIQRISSETYYCGAPPSPTPSPTAAPEMSDTGKTTAKEPTPTPTPVPTMSPDDPLYAWRHDPVEAFSYTTQYQEDGTSTATISFTMKHTYTSQVYEDEWNYYICIKRPQEIYDKIIVIDAGHGGNDPGTSSAGGGYMEKTMNLSIVLYLKEILDAQEEIKVYYTRTTDCKPSLSQRIALANDIEADFFLSIHCNANLSKSLNGTEVLYSAAQNSWTGMNSKRFAQICMAAMDEWLGLKNRGLVARDHNVTVLHDAEVAAALVEVAFMTNVSDMEILAKEESRKKIAEGLYQAILRGYEELEEMSDE